MGYLDKKLGLAQADALRREADLVEAIAACDRASSLHNEAKAVQLRLQADAAAHNVSQREVPPALMDPTNQ